jgi:Holliday junction resolvase-like predicted endonuclease
MKKKRIKNHLKLNIKMDYFEDDLIETEVSSSINFIELKHKLQQKLEELKLAVKDNDKKKIDTICKDMDKFLNEYW